MDALILSCGTGGGHNAAAAALKEEMERLGHHVTMLNPYDLSGQKVAHRVDHTYISIAQKVPKFFGVIYQLGQMYRRLPWRSPVYFANGLMAERMKEYLQTHPVDVILMTHLFPCEILTYLKNHDAPIPKTVFVATDYTNIPFSEECICDAYVIPSPALKTEYTARGVPEERIYPLGIPVRRDFHRTMSREDAKKQLGLDTGKRYILITGGSMGAGKLEKTVNILRALTKDRPELRLVVVCGSNQDLCDRLRKRFGGTVDVIGQTDQMALYLQSSELYLTKPGGLSTTEAAVSGTLLGLLPPIPGCETSNIKFYESRGMCRRVKVTQKCLRQLLELMDDKQAANEMIARQHQHISADAAEAICALACGLVSGQ